MDGEKVAYVFVGPNPLFCGTEEMAWWTAWKWAALEPAGQQLITLVLGEPRGARSERFCREGMMILALITMAGPVYNKCEDEEEAKLYIKAVKDAEADEGWLIGPEPNDGLPVHVRISRITAMQYFEPPADPKIVKPKLVIPRDGRDN